MLTNRAKRLLSKENMAKKRAEKERIKKLKDQGLVEYEGEIIPLLEARRRWGQKGAVHGYKGKLNSGL